MLTGKDIIWAIIAPAVIAAVAMVVARLVSGQNREPRSWGPAAGIALGFAAAFISVRSLPKLPPASADGWLLWAVVPILIVSVVASLGKGWRVVAWIASIIVLIAIDAALVWPRKKAIASDEFQHLLILTAGAMVIWWVAMEFLAMRMRAAALPVLLAVWTLVSGAVLMNSGSQALGQLAGAAAFSLAAIAAIAIVFRMTSLAGGGMLAVAAIVLGLLLYGHIYSEVSERDVILLTIAPLTLWIGELPIIRSRPAVRVSARIILMLALLAAPAFTAAKGLQKTMKDQTDSYQY